jgi:hypothetical protein
VGTAETTEMPGTTSKDKACLDACLGLLRAGGVGERVAVDEPDDRSAALGMPGDQPGACRRGQRNAGVVGSDDTHLGRWQRRGAVLAHRGADAGHQVGLSGVLEQDHVGSAQQLDRPHSQQAGIPRTGAHEGDVTGRRSPHPAHQRDVTDRGADRGTDRSAGCSAGCRRADGAGRGDLLDRLRPVE